MQSASAASGQPLTLSARFPAESVRVDNTTNQWYVVVGLPGAFIPPYTVGVTLPLDGAASVQVAPQAPAQTAQPALVTGEAYTVTLSSDARPADSGTPLPGAGVPSQIVSSHFTVGTGGAMHVTAQPTARMLALHADPANTDWIGFGLFSVIMTQGIAGIWRIHPGETVSVANVAPVSLGVAANSGVQALDLLMVI
ncbi:MAG: hypothetical protein KGK07_13545 [Chloroflexota bacterium]|nr:hypothetical protein [Chloroflexota bacterium]